MGNEQQFSCYEFLYKFTKLKKKKNYLINIICYKINKRFFFKSVITSLLSLQFVIFLFKKGKKFILFLLLSNFPSKHLWIFQFILSDTVHYIRGRDLWFTSSYLTRVDASCLPVSVKNKNKSFPKLYQKYYYAHLLTLTFYINAALKSFRICFKKSQLVKLLNTGK